MLVLCFVGVMLGDCIIFLLGKKYGRRILQSGLFSRILPASRLDAVEIEFRKKGNPLIFAARFMPGLRAPIFFTAGTLKVPFKVFFFYDGLAALLSVPAIIYLTYFYGDQLEWIVDQVRTFEYGVVGLVLVVVVFLAFKYHRSRSKLGLVLIFALFSFFPISHGSSKAPLVVPSTVPSTPTRSPTVPPQSLEKWCQDIDQAVKGMNWTIPKCKTDGLIVDGTSVKGSLLVYKEYGDPKSENVTLVLSTVHGDETTSFYIGVKLMLWLEENIAKSPDTFVVLAPLVNPDGFFSPKKSRLNANGIDVNRNFFTKDWEARALRDWKRKTKSNPRRFPGQRPDSEPETLFQKRLIEKYRPRKILSIHAPLNFMDYDGPNTLSLDRFPNDYVRNSMELQKKVNAVSGGYYPGSLGNFAGQEQGIPTLTLELPSADAGNAESYWNKFKGGMKTIIDFKMPSPHGKK
jgi:protein MpaA